MTDICVGAMLLNDFVVCCEKRPEWESLDLGFPLCANDNLVEEPDIWKSRGQSETIQGSADMYAMVYLPSSERDAFSSVKARR